MEDDLLLEQDKREDAKKRILSYAKSARSDATLRAYQSDFKQYSCWCDVNGFKALPSTPDQISLYLISMRDGGMKSSTIRRHITSIRIVHKTAGFEPPTNELTRNLEAGIRREIGTAQRRARPITIAVLRRLLANPRVFWKRSTGFAYRDNAIILLGWSAALRRSEIALLQIEDIEFVDDGLVLTLPKSKTDQEGQGRKIGIPFVADRDLCAVIAVRKWIDWLGLKTGPLFPQLGMNYLPKDVPLEGQSIQRILRQRLKIAGYNQLEYSGHSLRAGFATSAAAAGVSALDMRRITGHNSDRQLSLYVREGLIFSNHPLTAMLGKVLPEGKVLSEGVDQYSKSLSSEGQS